MCPAPAVGGAGRVVVAAVHLGQTEAAIAVVAVLQLDHRSVGDALAAQTGQVPVE